MEINYLGLVPVGLFLVLFIFAVAAAATPFAKIDSYSSGLPYTFNAFQDCLGDQCFNEGGLLTDCTAFRTTKGADAAFLVFTCLGAAVSGLAALGVVFSPSITKGSGRFLITFLSACVVFVALIAMATGFALFGTHCGTDMEATYGAKRGPQGFLSMTAFLIGIGVIVFEFFFGMKDISPPETAAAEGSTTDPTNNAPSAVAADGGADNVNPLKNVGGGDDEQANNQNDGEATNGTSSPDNANLQISA